MTTNNRPNGSRIQRSRRHIAEARRAVVEAAAYGRAKAQAALLVHARDRALPVRMPSGIQTARTAGDKIRHWALNTAARIVAWKIEKDTWKVALERRKMSFADFVDAMQRGGQLTRMARQ